jgi:hypothetical protein
MVGIPFGGKTGGRVWERHKLGGTAAKVNVLTEPSRPLIIVSQRSQVWDGDLVEETSAMIDGNLWGLIWSAFPLIALGFMAYAIRRGGRLQQTQLQKYEENRTMQLEMMERQRRMLELTEENIEIQHEIHALLERAVNALERRV